MSLQIHNEHKKWFNNSLQKKENFANDYAFSEVE